MTAINISSESACRAAYIDYHMGNQGQYTALQIGQIVEHWKTRLQSWQDSCDDIDETQWDIEDNKALNDYMENWESETGSTAYSDGVEDGKEEAEDKTGHDGDFTREYSENIVMGVGSAAGTVISTSVSAMEGCWEWGGNITMSQAGKGMKAVGEGIKNIGKKSASEGSKETTKEVVKDASAIIAAVIAIATAIAYWIRNPNKDEIAACETLNDTVLPQAEKDTENAKKEILDATRKIGEMSDEATDKNEQANQDISDKKAEFDQYRASFEELQAKIDAGEVLSDSEKELYKELAELLAGFEEEITEIEETTSSEVKALQTDIESSQNVFDDAASTIGEVQGTVTYAGQIAGNEIAVTTIEGVSQTANAVSAGIAGARLCGMGPWLMALGILSIAAGVSSAVAAVMQFMGLAKGVETLSTKNDVQGLNVDTGKDFAKNVTIAESFQDGVKDLELYIPDDMDTPEAIDVDTLAEPEDNQTI